MSCKPNRFIRLLFNLIITVGIDDQNVKKGENELMGHPLFGDLVLPDKPLFFR